MRRIIPLVCGILLVLAIAAQPASATPPAEVEIVHEAYWDDGFGTFELTGGDLKDCESGTTVDLLFFGGGREGIIANWHVVKQLTCADESGTFTILIHAQTRDLRTDWGTWTVLSGTGDYEKLHGTGDLFGIYKYEDPDGPDVGIDETLTGKMHFG